MLDLTLMRAIGLNHSPRWIGKSVTSLNVNSLAGTFVTTVRLASNQFSSEGSA